MSVRRKGKMKPCKNFRECGNQTKDNKTWCVDCAITHIAKKSGYKPLGKIDDLDCYCMVLTYDKEKK